MNEWIDAFLATVSSLDPVARTLLAGLAVLAETSILIGLIVPGDVTLLVASTAIDGWAQWAMTIVVVVLGSLGGESIGFWIGHWLGPGLARSWVGRRLGAERIERADRLLARRGGPAIFASRFLPVLHSLVPLVAGMAAVPYRRFLAWTAPACAIWALAYVSVGALATAGYRELAGELHWAGLVFGGIFVVFGIALWLARRRLARAMGEHGRGGDGVRDEGGRGERDREEPQSAPASADPAP